MDQRPERRHCAPGEGGPVRFVGLVRLAVEGVVRFVFCNGVGVCW